MGKNKKSMQIPMRYKYEQNVFHSKCKVTAVTG